MQVEVTIAHPTGIVEVYVGDLDGEKIELTDNVTVRTATARKVERSERLYAIVEGDLAYAIDIAAEGHDIRPAPVRPAAAQDLTGPRKADDPRAFPCAEPNHGPSGLDGTRGSGVCLVFAGAGARAPNEQRRVDHETGD